MSKWTDLPIRQRKPQESGEIVPARTGGYGSEPYKGMNLNAARVGADDFKKIPSKFGERLVPYKFGARHGDESQGVDPVFDLDDDSNAIDPDDGNLDD